MTRLNFTDQGEPVGSVHVEDGELRGDDALVQIVESRRLRKGLGPAEALEEMNGWSNGYVKAHLEPANETGSAGKEEA